MSGISTSVGLISGINTAELIDKLIALESRPVTNLQNRVKALDAERTTFLAISAQLMAMKTIAAKFAKSSFFSQYTATSSNEDVLTAVAGEDALPGSATFRVHSLVSNHAVVSRGFADADRTPVGAGMLTIEVGQGGVDPTVELAALNGGRGVRRGVIAVTDRSGATAEIDLTKAVTIDDVLEAINASTKVSVRASVTSLASNGATGDRIVIQDLSGGSGNLIVADAGGGFTAADLGIAANVSTGRIDGADLIRLSSSTTLSSLNDGNGVDRYAQGATVDDLYFTTSFGTFGVSLGDVMRLSTDLRALNGGNGVRLGVIRITDRGGASAEVDLTDARTVGDVRDAINSAGIGVSATVVNSRFLLTDSTGATGESAKNFKIEEVSGFAATDLGIAADVAGGAINGRDVYRMATVGDLVRAINYAPGNNSLVEASISADGNGITLRALGFENSVTVSAGVDSAGNVSQAAGDLGLLDASFSTNEAFATRALVGGLNTVLLSSLRGGRGAATGAVSFTDQLNRTTVIDFTSARTLQDVVDLINADETTSLVAAVNDAGNGIVIRDESGGSTPIVIQDMSGTLAADLGISGSLDPIDGDTIDGGNLQLQYVSRQTKLADLNAGRGVELGTIRITDSTGAAHTIPLGSNLKTVGQVIDVINAATPDTIEARINDTGDGLIIIDTAGGSSRLNIEDRDGGRAAADLRMAGTAREGQNYIDGTFEARINVGPGDTLASIVEKLNQAGLDVAASVINDGGSSNPFSLTISSTVSGRRGELLIDTGGLDLGLSTLTRARDAVVTIGQPGSSAALVITGSSNTLEDIMPGVTLDLHSTSNQDVTVTTAQDVDGIVESISDFVDKYNDLQKAIDDATQFNSDTLERGPLLGDATINVIRSRLHGTVTRGFDGITGPVSRLLNVGLRLGANNRLEFDEERFRTVYAESPEKVAALFTTEDTGFGAVLETTLEDLTDDIDGLIPRKDELLSDQQKVLNDRIDSLNILLAAKRRRLEAQFAGLETTLAALQDQQTALSQLAQLASQ